MKKKLPKLGKLQKQCDTVMQQVGKKIIKECKKCGVQFSVYISDLKRGRRRLFCNNECRVKFCKIFPPKGWKHTADYKKRLSLSRMGEKNPNYISGSTKKRRGKTQRNKIWRNKVFKRDDYECQECEKRGGYKEAHHIIFWSEDKKKRFLVGNGVTLCFSCHKNIHRTERIYKNLLCGKIKL